MHAFKVGEAGIGLMFYLPSFQKYNILVSYLLPYRNVHLKIKKVIRWQNGNTLSVCIHCGNTLSDE